MRDWIATMSPVGDLANSKMQSTQYSLRVNGFVHLAIDSFWWIRSWKILTEISVPYSDIQFTKYNTVCDGLG